MASATFLQRRRRKAAWVGLLALVALMVELPAAALCCGPRSACCPAATEPAAQPRIGASESDCCSSAIESEKPSVCVRLGARQAWPAMTLAFGTALTADLACHGPAAETWLEPYTSPPSRLRATRAPPLG